MTNGYCRECKCHWSTHDNVKEIVKLVTTVVKELASNKFKKLQVVTKGL